MKPNSWSQWAVRTGTLVIAMGVSFTACSGSQRQVPLPSTVTQLAALPKDPCKTLSKDQVSLVTGLDVSEPVRAPSLEKVVRAQEHGTQPGPGTICVYNTSSLFGAIELGVPQERSRALYWDSRDSSFERFPGSAEAIASLGEDAYIAGGTHLRVLTPNGEFFSVATQMYQPQSRDLLIKLAQTVLKSLGGQ